MFYNYQEDEMLRVLADRALKMGYPGVIGSAVCQTDVIIKLGDQIILTSTSYMNFLGPVRRPMEI